MTVADLTPDALARLEAKLVADLDVVRKVRALLEEHRIPSGIAAVPSGAGATPSLVAAEPSARAGIPVPGAPVPQVPRKPYEEIFIESLKAMPAEGFNLGPLKQALRKAGMNPSDSGVKTDMNRLIRQGKVVVVKTATGRIGSTYRYVVPVEASAEKGEQETHRLAAADTDGATNAVSGAVSGEKQAP